MISYYETYTCNTFWRCWNKTMAFIMGGDCLKTQSPSVKFDGKDKKRH